MLRRTRRPLCLLEPVAARRGRARRPRDRGFVLAWLATMMVTLLGFAGFAVDLGHWYLTASRVQNAADAAALGGVVFLPSDLSTATDVATELAVSHGFDASGVTVSQGERSNQLEVAIDTDVDNFFVSLFGLTTTSIGRDALAEFEGPVPMGSPESYLGDDPESGNNPDFWMNNGSLRNNQANGDRFQAGNCNSSAAPCVSGTPSSGNYANNGYFFVVEVTASMASEPLVIQAFDPAFYEVGDVCERDQNAIWGQSGQEAADADALRAAVAAEPLVPAGWYDDAESRYERGNTDWCTGDWRAGASTGGGGPIDTTFIVRSPDDTPWLDSDNPVIDRPGCAPVQFEGYPEDWMDDETVWERLTPDGDPNGEWRVDVDEQTFANTFRRWVTVCEIPAAQVQPGRYLLQVRTNSALGAPLVSDTSVDTWGHNRYAIRSGWGDPADGDTDGIRMYANGRFPIYANADSADTTFYLARVLPGATQRILNLTLWDISDGGSSGTLRIRPPVEATVDGANLDSFSGCTFEKSGGSWSTDSGQCSFSFSSSALNADLVTVGVPIPDGYDCDETSATGCWVYVEAPFNGSVNDTTTWSADIIGDPVRLVE